MIEKSEFESLVKKTAIGLRSSSLPFETDVSSRESLIDSPVFDEIKLIPKKTAGIGQKVSGPILEASYKERVDFGKIIGEYALESKGKPTKYIPTSKGIIHYDKNGKIHVIPSDPFAIME